MPREHARLVSVAAVERRLPAAGLPLGELYFPADALQHVGHGKADLRKHLVDDAGDEQRNSSFSQLRIIFVQRRWFVSALFAAVRAFAADASSSLRGILKPGGILQVSGRAVKLTGDEPTMLVLNDARLAGSDFEVSGSHRTADEFAVAPIHTHSLFVYRGARKLNVSYWCDICYIRTWSPGKCWCCQEDTRLDPVDPATVEKAK